ncbi:glycosyltransferase family 4 protein [Bacillus sp. D386]|uniref:glycosyltransferase family 4 protein n=1 Tax=Bacillus sp. D386 TaxID=2587155 RepID=UPI001124BCE2|nr:glycosyltransferase family 4 protein [Bacillus sp. D386]
MKQKKVLYIVRESLHLYPPCISQILFLNDNGVDVTVICGDCDSKLIDIFRKRNINCILTGNKRVKIKLFGKVFSYLKFRYNILNLFKKLYDENTVLWFGTADSAIALSGKLENKKYVLSVLELYDKYPFYLKGLKRLIGDAAIVIACEETRARIMKSWWNLQTLPYVMPNKPYPNNDMYEMEGSTEIKDAISKIQNKKVILYQGVISADRDLGILAEALKEMNSEYLLVLIGKSFYDGVNKVKSIYNKTVYLGYFPAPQHLQITPYATIGIANYDDSSLNNLFCAPNKIFEYTHFGKPILGSDVPGLVNTIGKSGAGECIDFTDKLSIVSAIKKIESNYSEYVDNAKSFYESVDNNLIIKRIIEEIFKED